MDLRDWNPSVVLYRLAKENAHKAKSFAAESSVEPQREIDACIATLVLAQAALEAWINWTAGQVGVVLSGGLIRRWAECPRIAEKAGRLPSPELSPSDRDFLEELSAWRNFLLHGDDKAREKLAQLGLRLEDLGASLARQTLRNADAVFEYGNSATGGQLLRSEHLWPGFGGV